MQFSHKTILPCNSKFQMLTTVHGMSLTYKEGKFGITFVFEPEMYFRKKRGGCC